VIIFRHVEVVRILTYDSATLLGRLTKVCFTDPQDPFFLVPPEAIVL